MEEEVKIVQQYYDNDVLQEWRRLEEHPFEFILTTRMMDRYIKPGDKILDIGGGPGRYSLYFAKKGCEVTLVDLSSGNVNFALNKAAELGVNLKVAAGDAREIDKLVEGTFDHVFIMGPLYHLINEADRIKVINAALSKLKEGGTIYVSFILMFSGLIFGMRDYPELIMEETSRVFVDSALKDTSYGGDAFTKAFFYSKKDILPFMEQFPLSKLHLFSQESILAPCERNILSQRQEVIDKWVDAAELVCEREDLLGYSEHVMYVGKK